MLNLRLFSVQITNRFIEMSDHSNVGSAGDISSISTGSLHSIPFETFFDYFDPVYKTPFYDACVTDDIEAAKEILANGNINVNRRDNRDDTFLHTAVKKNSINVIKLLLTVENINVNLQNYQGNTPLHLVHKPEILEILINAGANLELKNNYGETPLLALFFHECSIDMCFNGDERPEVMLCFLKNGVNPIADDGQETLMHKLLNQGPVEEKLELISMLLYFGGDVNLKVSPTLPSAFLYAVKNDVPLSIIDLLFPFVTDFNEVFNESLLMYAMIQLNPRVMDFIKNSADCSYANETESCLSLALNYEDASIFEYIWNNCDLERVFKKHKTFLYSYLLNENVSGLNFLKYLYEIMSCKYAPELLQNASSEPIYELLVNAFDRYEIEKEERVKMLYTFLSMSGEMSILNLYYVFNKYGFNEEFETFLTATVECDAFIYLDPILFKCICFPHLSNCVRKRGVVYSLKVLSRDAYRSTLRRPKNGVYFQYYNDVQKLEIPQVIKDIICFKKVLS